MSGHSHRTERAKQGLRQARCISCVLSQWMRVIFLTLRADNLPETGKRQYENKQDANLTRRHGVDCTTIRQGKICAVVFASNETRPAFRCDAMASTAQRSGRKKFARSFFRQPKRDTHSGAAQHLKN